MQIVTEATEWAVAAFVAAACIGLYLAIVLAAATAGTFIVRTGIRIVAAIRNHNNKETSP